MKQSRALSRLASLTLAAALGLSLAACSSNDTPSASSPSGGSDPAQTGAVVADAAVAVGSTAPQFLGHFDASQYFSTECSTAAAYLLYDQLFSIGSDGVWYSDILSDYHWSEEVENQLVMTLKDHIYFSNGDQMTMGDVLYSLERFSQSPRGATNFTVVDFDASTVSEDGMTLYLQYTQPYGPWQSGLNQFILNQEFVEGLGDSADWYSAESVCGSGPYQVAESVTDISITLEKRSDWWMADEAGDSATVQQITCYSYSDNTTMMADYMNGVIDVAINLTANDCSEIGADSSLGTYQTVSSNAAAVIVLSPENGDLQNEKLRQAICLGTDAAAIGDMAWGVLATPATSTLNESNPFYVGGHSYPFDQETAKQLVAESGVSDPTFNFVINTASTSNTIAEAFQYYMQEIGVTVNIQPYDQATATAEYWTKPGGTDFMINAAAIATASNEAADVYTFYRSSFAYPCTVQTDPVITGLLEDGRNTTDEAERARIYGEVQDWFYDNYSMIPIAQWSTAYAYNSRIGACDIPITGSPSLRYITVTG